MFILNYQETAITRYKFFGAFETAGEVAKHLDFLIIENNMFSLQLIDTKTNKVATCDSRDINGVCIWEIDEDATADLQQIKNSAERYESEKDGLLV